MTSHSGVIAGRATPRGRYPHFKIAGDFIYVSGTSSRRADDTFVGVDIVDGVKVLDVAAQTAAVIENIGGILSEAGASLADLVQVTCFLVDMADFPAYNEAYARYFDFNGPTRTTVAVRELPHPDLLIEIQAVAYIGNRAEGGQDV